MNQSIKQDQRKGERRQAFDAAAPKPVMRDAENRRVPDDHRAVPRWVDITTEVAMMIAANPALLSAAPSADAISLCKVCQTWARIDGRMTNHHPKCPAFTEERYVKATMDGCSYSVPQHQINTLFSDIGELAVGDKLTIEIVTMTKEEYDRLPDFNGF